MGISNTFATFSGIFSPSVAGYIVQNNVSNVFLWTLEASFRSSLNLIVIYHIISQSKAEWRIVFCISGLIYLFGAIFYAIFASGEVQPWAVEKTDKKIESDGKNKEKVAYENQAMTDITLDR